jgi:hypothetical protein
MDKRHEKYPEIPRTDFTPALECLLTEQYVTMDYNGIKIAKCLFELACDFDSDKMKTLFESIAPLSSETYDRVSDVIIDMSVLDNTESETDYLSGLTAIIKNFNFNTPDLSLNIKAVELATALEARKLADSIGSVQAEIAPWISNDEAGKKWSLLAGATAKYFDALDAHNTNDSPQHSDYNLEIYREFINSLASLDNFFTGKKEGD